MTVAPEPWMKKPTGWSRPMLGAEIVFAAFSRNPSGKGHGSLSTEITFSPPSSHLIPELDLAKLYRSAWIDVRYHLHPLLAAISTAPDNILNTAGYSLFYPFVHTDEVNDWAKETVHQHPPTTMLDLVASLKATSPTARSSRAILHFARSSAGDEVHVVFVTGHLIADGLGSFTILKHVLGYLNNPSIEFYKWGEEVEKLSIPLAVATGRRIAKSGQLVPLPQANVDKVLSMMMEGAGDMEPSYTQQLSTHKLPQTQKDVVRELSLSVSEDALLGLCRSHGVTITAHFSVLLALVFVGDDKRISESKDVQLPFLSINRGHDLLDEYKASVGLQLTLSPFAFDAQAIRKCQESRDFGTGSQIWKLAATAKDQLVSAKSDDTPLIYEHEIVCALLPHLLSSGGDSLFRTAVPFMTSVGRITPLFTTADTASPSSASASSFPSAEKEKEKEKRKEWQVVKVANSFTIDWFRPVCHIWEWKGRTTIRMVATGEYDALHSVERMRDGMGEYVRQLLLSQ